MNPCSARALWIASATAHTSLSLTASLIANAWLPHQRHLSKPAAKPRSELWDRNCNPGHLNELFPTLPEKTSDAASRRITLMSFEGMGKSIQTNGAPIRRPTPRSSLDEFPAGYSLTRCSPAELVSASPAGIQHDAGLAQLRGKS